VKLRMNQSCLVAVCLLLTPAAALAALPPKLGIQRLSPDFIVFHGTINGTPGTRLSLPTTR
jgi:hypothetical protein